MRESGLRLGYLAINLAVTSVLLPLVLLTVLTFGAVAVTGAFVVAIIKYGRDDTFMFHDKLCRIIDNIRKDYL